jgi:hypothetical protein
VRLFTNLVTIVSHSSWRECDIAAMVVGGNKKRESTAGLRSRGDEGNKGDAPGDGAHTCCA